MGCVGAWVESPYHLLPSRWKSIRAPNYRQQWLVRGDSEQAVEAEVQHAHAGDGGQRAGTRPGASKRRIAWKIWPGVVVKHACCR
jgi:hypothetical protein